MKRSLAGLVAYLLCCSGAASAQEPLDTVRLEPLVVTATRTPTPASALPLATTVITGRQLRERGVRTVADALQDLPGAAVAAPGSYGGVTALFLRGGNSGYVKVLVDGVPVNSPGGSYDFAHLSTEDVERIEVVRGPGSVLYGSDAVTGVVQIFTRRGAGPLRADASFSGGRGRRLPAAAVPATGGYDLTNWSADAGGGGRRLGWSLGASRFASDGLYPVNNGYLGTTLAGRLDLRPDDATSAALTVRRTGGDYHYPTDGGGNIVDANTATRTDAWVAALEAGRRLGTLDAHLLLGGDWTQRADLDPRDGPADTLGSYAAEGHADDARRSADLHLDWHAGAGTLLTAGASLEREQEHAHSWSLSQWGDSRDSSEVARTTRGYYAQLLASPLAGMSFTGGLRLDDNSRFGRFTTYRAGLAYALPTGTRLRAAAGTAFKEPSFYENFARGYAIGNPDLRPERSTSRELGVEQTWAGGRLSVNATGFDQRFRDLIQYTAQTPAPGAPNYQNLGAARASGLELDLGFAPRPALRLDASYTYLHTSVTQEGAGGDPSFVAGRRLLRRPTHSATLTGGWHAGRGALSSTLAWVGSRDDLDFSDPNAWPAPRVVLPAYLRVDLAGELELVEPGHGRPSLSATFRVENALDRAYREMANFPARGRTVFLGGRLGLRD